MGTRISKAGFSEGAMMRERALRAVLLVVGVLFVATAYPMVIFDLIRACVVDDAQPFRAAIRWNFAQRMLHSIRDSMGLFSRLFRPTRVGEAGAKFLGFGYTPYYP
jgi:hypothetical protein